MIHKFILIVSGSMLVLNALRAMTGELVYEQLILSTILLTYSAGNLLTAPRVMSNA